MHEYHKVPANSDFFLSVTLDRSRRPIKIKIVTEKKRKLGAGMLSRAKRAPIRPYTLRVVRDEGGGLWTLEDSTGQLYLAVLSRENTRIRRGLIEAARASGRAYVPARSA